MEARVEIQRFGRYGAGFKRLRRDGQERQAVKLVHAPACRVRTPAEHVPVSPLKYDAVGLRTFFCNAFGIVIGEAHTGMLCDGRAKQLYLRCQALPVMGGEVDEQVVRA